MKISQMEYFSCVCQCGSITKAAKELHISQPSVTAAVHELEKELGVNLFLRRNNKIQLTEEGWFVQERIDGILKSMDTLNRDLNDFVGQKNHIRLGVPLQIGSFLLPLLFGKFRQEYPEISLEIGSGPFVGGLLSHLGCGVDASVQFRVLFLCLKGS